MRPRYWSRAWKTAAWIGRLSGAISPPSTADRGVVSWISSLRASRVNHSVSQEIGEGETMTVGSGTTSPESSTIADHPSCSSKTCRVCSLPLHERAYVAGLIDGEGCIGIAQSKGYFAARLDVGMSEPARMILNSLHRSFGGSLVQTRPETEKWAAAYRWTMQGKKARDFLRCIGQLLRLKRIQAELAVKAQDHPDLAASLKELMHELNAKGPEHGGWFARLVAGKWIGPPTLFDHSPTFSATWPTSGSMRNGVCSLRSRSARPISDSGSSCWPTMTVADSNGRSYQYGNYDKTKRRLGLLGVARLFPTPDASVRGGFNKSRSAGAANRPTLATAAKLWPTPNATDYKGPSTRSVGKERSRSDDDLPTRISREVFPTPTANRRDGLQSHRVNVVGGQLNPTWVEWLMGWPLGWTDCAHSATASFQRWRRAHSLNSGSDA